MDKFWIVMPWLARLVLLAPTALLLSFAHGNSLHPVEILAARGIDFHSGNGITVGRVAFGAFPLGCALFMLFCIISERRLLTGLTFFAMLDTSILVVRIFGMFTDASVQENIRLVNAEVVLLVFAGAGIFLESRRRAHMQRNDLQRGANPVIAGGSNPEIVRSLHG